MEDILEIARQGRLQWFGHVYIWVLRKAEKIQVIGNRLPGRPKDPWISWYRET